MTVATSTTGGGGITFDLGLHPAMQITWIARKATRLGLLFVRNFMNVFIANPALQWCDFAVIRLMRPKPLYYRTDNDMLSVWNWEGVESGKTSRLGSLLNGKQSPNPV